MLNAHVPESVWQAFFQLHRLVKLGLSDNAFQHLPNDIGRFTGLVELDISKNGDRWL
jgi:hypothetical protein